MPVLNDASNLLIGGVQVQVARHRGADVWVLPIPVNTVAPAVTGGTSIGSTLTCGNGTWTNSPTSYAYQWEADTGAGYADLTGETASTLDTTGMASGDLVRCKVVASNAYGASAPATSNATTLSSGTLRIFGADSITGGGGPNSEDRMWASKFVKSNSGAVTAIFANIANVNGVGNNARVVAMADSAGVPGTVLWYTAATAIPASSGDIEFTVPGDVSGTNAAGTYWLGVVTSDFQGQVSFGSSTGTDAVLSNAFSFASPPATCPAPDNTYADQAIGAWCEYIG